MNESDEREILHRLHESAQAAAEAYRVQVERCVRLGVLPPVEAATVVYAGEPEPVGVAMHRTRGGRGAVARLREKA